MQAAPIRSCGPSHRRVGLASYAPTHATRGFRPTGPALCETGQRWVWDGVTFEVKHPDPADHLRAGAPSNVLSCVLRISNGRQVAWLTYDVGHDQEVRLAATRASG